MANESQTMARGLGYLSLGLGFSQLLAPRWFSRRIGVEPRDENDTIVRLIGLREILAGTGLLTSGNPAPWVWLRVGGDLMDLALLGRAASSDAVDRERVNGALAGTVAVTAMDVLSGVGATTASNGNGHGNGHGNGQGHRNGMPYRMNGKGASPYGGSNPGPTAVLSNLGEKIRDGVMGGKPVRKAITIAKPASELYGYWRRLENLPRFMRHLESVQERDGRRSHWVATAPLGMKVEWDAEITDEVENERISWQSVEGSSVNHAGTVRFVPAPGDRGTEVHVQLTYQPPAGPIGVAVAKLAGEEPSQQISEDLRRLKQVMETGTVIHSEATGGERRLRQRPAQPAEAAAEAGL